MTELSAGCEMIVAYCSQIPVEGVQISGKYAFGEKECELKAADAWDIESNHTC